jgi:hypothetical protein
MGPVELPAACSFIKASKPAQSGAAALVPPELKVPVEWL